MIGSAALAGLPAGVQVTALPELHVKSKSQAVQADVLHGFTGAEPRPCRRRGCCGRQRATEDEMGFKNDVTQGWKSGWRGGYRT